MSRKKPDIIANCIYCHEDKVMSEEHYLSDGLGKFRYFEPLVDKICRECNTLCGRCEEQFLRTSEVAILRNMLGIEGKKKHKKVNIFLRGSAGLGPIEVLGRPPGWDKDVRVEMLSGTKNIQYLTQIIVTTKLDEKYHILIPDVMTEPSQLQDKLHQLDIENIKHISLICPEDKKDRFERLVEGMDYASEEWEYLPESGTMSLKASVEITEKYYQAITKIGFHYLLKHTRYRGDEEMFAETKNFILNGGDFSSFLFTNEEQIIQRVKKGGTPEEFMHIIRATDYPDEVSCDLQLFLGPDFVPFVYSLRWKNSSPIEYRYAIAHQFTYYKGGRKDGFDGEMREHAPVRKSLVI